MPYRLTGTLKMVPFRCFPAFQPGVLSVALLFALLGQSHAEPVIREFMASNDSTLADEDGAFSDWIEIFNPDSSPVNLGGWYLTDSAKKKSKWAIPAVTLASNGFLVVFASGKNRTDPAKP